MDACELIAERKILEAMEEGAFDNLEGYGQPLDLSFDPFEKPELRMAHRLLKNNGFVPRWVEEGREIDDAIRRARPNMPEQERKALNIRIAAFNTHAPSTAHRAPISAPNSDRAPGPPGSGASS